MIVILATTLTFNCDPSLSLTFVIFFAMTLGLKVTMVGVVVVVVVVPLAFTLFFKPRRLVFRGSAAWFKQLHVITAGFVVRGVKLLATVCVMADAWVSSIDVRVRQRLVSSIDVRVRRQRPMPGIGVRVRQRLVSGIDVRVRQRLVSGICVGVRQRLSDAWQEHDRGATGCRCMEQEKDWGRKIREKRTEKKKEQHSFAVAVVYRHCLMTLPHAISETLKWLSSRPFLMQNFLVVTV